MQTNLCQMLQNVQEISYCLLCNIMSDNFVCVVCCFGGDHKGFLTKSNLNFTGVWCKNGYT